MPQPHSDGPAEAPIEAITAHLELHLGPIVKVAHERKSQAIHVDVHIIAPTSDRPYLTLVTTGLSARPMKVPPEMPHVRYAELMLHLPAHWLVGTAHLDKAEYGWPIGILVHLARYPHTQKTWIGLGHTLPLGKQPGVGFSSLLLIKPQLVSDSFDPLVLEDGRKISFLHVLPLYKEELQLFLHGPEEALFARFEEAGISPVLNPRRANVGLPAATTSKN